MCMMKNPMCMCQLKMDPAEAVAALAEACCYRCGVSANRLMNRGEILEVCSEEYCDDLSTGEVIAVPIALCPECHRINHLDVRGHHRPCHIKARQSYETL